MFELCIVQKIKYDEEIILYFKEEQFEEMMNVISSMVKHSNSEIRFSFRQIEDGQIEEEEE